MNPIIVFISGNRISSPFKILDIKETVLPVGSRNVRTRARSIDTPSLTSLLKAKSADDFQGLKATEEKENSFKDHPNHFMIGNEILKLVEGSRGTALAKDLAWKINQDLTQKEDDEDHHKDDDDEKSILHYLWIVSNNKCHTINVLNIPDDDGGLDQHYQRIREKLTGNPLVPAPHGVAGDINIGVDPTFIATQSALLTTANSINARLLAQTERETSGKSVLKGMAPKDRDLFTHLCTSDLKNEPAQMSSFMTSVLVEKSPSRMAQQLREIHI